MTDIEHGAFEYQKLICNRYAIMTVFKAQRCTIIAHRILTLLPSCVCSDGQRSEKTEEARTMKRFLTAVLLMAALTVFLAAPALALEKGGDGYYRLGTPDDFEAFAAKVNGGEYTAKAKLTNDIKFGDAIITDWHTKYMLGLAEDKAFKGILDGQGHKITLKVERQDGENNIGIVGFLGEGGKVVNLAAAGSLKCKDGGRVGAVAGSSHGGTIENCINEAYVEADPRSNEGMAGGMVGYAKDTLVKNCVNTGNIESYNGAGGIAGRINNTDIDGCYNSGAIKIYHLTLRGAGGIVGTIEGSSGGAVKNCGTSGAVNGGKTRGAVVGWKYAESKVENCKWYQGAGPTYGIGYIYETEAGSNEGAEMAYSLSNFPVYSIILDSYVKSGSSFKLTATAYPAQADGAYTLRLVPEAGLSVVGKTLDNGVEKEVQVERANAAKNYKVKVVPNDADTPYAEFTVLRVAGSGGGGGGGGGCNSGFAALALIALAPLALRRKK
jgi:Synergist-CTERM protein sorting domain-containing protein